MDIKEFMLEGKETRSFTLGGREQPKQVRQLSDAEFKELYLHKAVKYGVWKKITALKRVLSSEQDTYSFISMLIYEVRTKKSESEELLRNALELYSVTEDGTEVKKDEEDERGTAGFYEHETGTEVHTGGETIRNFSMDQYRSMKDFYKEEYVSWRNSFNRGETPRAEINYIMMYIFEVLNGRDRRPVAESVRRLISAYSDSFQGLEEFLRRWVDGNGGETARGRGASFTDKAGSRFKSREERFVDEALAYRDREGTACPFVPYPQRTLSFSLLSDERLNYYLYFRSEARKGSFIRSDTGYVLLYANEIINNIGTEPGEGADMLISLFGNYKDSIPAVREELPGWIIDYLTYYGVERDIREICLNTKGAYFGSRYEKMLNYMLRQKPLIVSYDMLQIMSDYYPDQNRFYEGHEELFNRFIPEAFSLIDSFMRRDGGQGIYDRFLLKRSYRISRLFDHALFLRTKDAKDTGYIYNFTSNLSMREFVTGFFRTVENALRDAAGEKSKLRNVKFDPEMKRLIESYISREMKKDEPHEEEEKTDIVIDGSRLKKAMADAERTVEMLSTDGPAELPGQDEKQLAIIDCLVMNGGRADENSLRDVDPDYILVIDSINMRSLMENDRILINDNEGTFTMDAELMKRYEKKVAPSGEVSKENTEKPEEGRQDVFDAIEKAFISAALDEDEEEMNRIALENGTMPELMEEVINEKALDSFGDILLEGGSVIEDYRETALEITGGN